MGGGRIANPQNSTVAPNNISSSMAIILSPELEAKTAPVIALMSARAPFPLPTSGLESPMEPSLAGLSAQGDSSSVVSLGRANA